MKWKVGFWWQGRLEYPGENLEGVQSQQSQPTDVDALGSKTGALVLSTLRMPL